MLTFRRAKEADMLLYFEWANDETVRKNAINKSKIIFEDHIKWFNGKLANPGTIMLVFSKGDIEIGQLRIEIDVTTNEAVIDYSLDKNSWGKGFGTQLLLQGYEYFSKLGKQLPLTGLVKVNNMASISAFIKAGYAKKEGMIIIKGEEYFKFSKDA